MVPLFSLEYSVWFCEQQEYAHRSFASLAGLGGSAQLSIGWRCYRRSLRCRASRTGIAIYSLAPLLGPVVGPVAGAWIAGKINLALGGMSLSVLLYSFPGVDEYSSGRRPL
jgi:hypothetical protein